MLWFRWELRAVKISYNLSEMGRCLFLLLVGPVPSVAAEIWGLVPGRGPAGFSVSPGPLHWWGFSNRTAVCPSDSCKLPSPPTSSPSRAPTSWATVKASLWQLPYRAHGKGQALQPCFSIPCLCAMPRSLFSLLAAPASLPPLFGHF